MSKNRHLSLRKNEKELGHLRGPNGRRLCRWCKKEVSPPRRTFCSDECSHEWKLRSSGKYLREHTYKRDLGRCNICKVDTRLQKIQIEDALQAAGGDRKNPDFRALLKSFGLTVSESEKSLWQADHIRPIENGGGLCGLSGIQTLCVKCHKAKTGRQASYRAKPVGFQPSKVPGLPGLDSFRGFSGKF